MPPRRASRLGEHSREVLAQAGYGEAEIEALIAAGAVHAGAPAVPDTPNAAEAPWPRPPVRRAARLAYLHPGSVLRLVQNVYSLQSSGAGGR